MTRHISRKNPYRRVVNPIKTMSLFRPSLESSPSAAPAEAGGQRTSEILGEAIMDSVSSVRDSLPEQHRAHFETLRQEIIDFTKAHGIPKYTLSKPDLLREAASKLSIPDLERLADLLERFEYLLKNGEPKKEERDPAKAIEYAERLYHLKEQYDSQVRLLEAVGILDNGAITGIDGKIYLVPTLEQIAVRLFERRKELSTKYDQGFTKLLLVPFGMSFSTLWKTFKQFLLSYKQKHPSFDLDTDDSLWEWKDYQGADTGDSPDLVYYPKSFERMGHRGKTKAQILKKQETLGQARGDGGQMGDDGWKGWTIHLLQPSDPGDPYSTGIAPIPRQGQGIPQGDLVPRPPLEANKTPNEYLSIFQKAQGDKDSPYHGETGMTPEDWIMAFMIHLSETGKPLDNFENKEECISCLAGVFFRSPIKVPFAFWRRGLHRADLGWVVPHLRGADIGVRSLVIL